MALLTLSLVLFAGLPQRANQAAQTDPVARRAAELRAKLGDEFTVVIERPFVVIGDGPPNQVRARAHRTVRWAVRHLKRDFFPNDPARPLDIWLFDGAKSYRRNALRLFGDRPDTPYGYYSPSDRALIMNIATGGGTLVHELVHPLMEANFPDCPAWLNEGLGSLYEHSSQRDGKIVGLTNWRLPGLQAAIRRGELPSFHALTHTTSYAFYEKDPGTNYAQARYLLMYLQERGLLRRFYWMVRKNHRTDPSGYAALRAVLHEEDMAGFMRRWQRWALGLSYE